VEETNFPMIEVSMIVEEYLRLKELDESSKENTV